MARIGNRNAAHLYEIETTVGKIEVDANTAAQAGKIARDAGYTVMSVNMIG